MREIDYSPLPEHMQEPFRLYIEKGIPMGSFGTAVCSNDLMGSFGRADDVNRERLFHTCAWLCNEAPIGCHGSPEHVADWIKSGGMKGLTDG